MNSLKFGVAVMVCSICCLCGCGGEGAPTALFQGKWSGYVVDQSIVVNGHPYYTQATITIDDGGGLTGSLYQIAPDPQAENPIQDFPGKYIVVATGSVSGHMDHQENVTASSVISSGTLQFTGKLVLSGSSNLTGNLSTTLTPTGGSPQQISELAAWLLHR